VRVAPREDAELRLWLRCADADACVLRAGDRDLEATRAWTRREVPLPRDALERAVGLGCAAAPCAVEWTGEVRVGEVASLWPEEVPEHPWADIDFEGPAITPDDPLRISSLGRDVWSCTTAEAPRLRCTEHPHGIVFGDFVVHVPGHEDTPVRLTGSELLVVVREADDGVVVERLLTQRSISLALAPDARVSDGHARLVVDVRGGHHCTGALSGEDVWTGERWLSRVRTRATASRPIVDGETWSSTLDPAASPIRVWQSLVPARADGSCPDPAEGRLSEVASAVVQRVDFAGDDLLQIVPNGLQ
jgi:hypothetical protein